MGESIRLNRLATVITDLDYPLSKHDALDELSDVTLVYADGEEPLPAVLQRANTEQFETPTDLETEIFNHVSIEAVGEPGQSEGDA